MAPVNLNFPKEISLMKSTRKQIKLVASLVLVPSLIFLNACSGIRVKVATDCAWAKDIHFSETTKTWLENLEWPKEAVEDFNQVALHNELYERFCLRGD